MAAGALAAAAGVGYGAQRAAGRRVRDRPDDGGDAALAPLRYDRAHRLESHDGGTLFVIERGQGTPIVLSHGVTLSVRVWVLQLAGLPEAGFRVIAYDHRGHGQSLVGDAGHTVENLGEDLAVILESLDLREALVLGHSMGGVAVQELALRHPEVLRERVRGIVLLSTLAKAPLGSYATRLKRRVERVASRVPDTSAIWATPNLGLLLARLGFGRDPKPSHVELARRIIGECAHETRVEAPQVLVGFDFTGELAALAVPALVIGGTADLLTPPRESEVLARRIPGARLVLLPGAGHMVMLERATELERLLVAFAREVGALPEGAAPNR